MLKTAYMAWHDILSNARTTRHTQIYGSSIENIFRACRLEIQSPLKATRPIPRHAVLLLFGLNPALHLTHIDAW